MIIKMTNMVADFREFGLMSVKDKSIQPLLAAIDVQFIITLFGKTPPKLDVNTTATRGRLN